MLKINIKILLSTNEFKQNEYRSKPIIIYLAAFVLNIIKERENSGKGFRCNS